MKTSHSRFAVAGVAGVLAAAGAIAGGATSHATTGDVAVSGATPQAAAPTSAAQTGPHPGDAPSTAASSSSAVRVVAAPGSCDHVPAGLLSTTVTFHQRAGSGPATYRVQVLETGSHSPIQTRAVRIGDRGPSTLNMVWKQSHQDRGDLTLRVIDADGSQVAVLDEAPGADPIAARCGATG